MAKTSDQPRSLKERNDEGSAVFPVAVQSECSFSFLIPRWRKGKYVYNELCCCLVISSWWALLLCLWWEKIWRSLTCGAQHRRPLSLCLSLSCRSGHPNHVRLSLLYYHTGWTSYSYLSTCTLWDWVETLKWNVFITIIIFPCQDIRRNENKKRVEGRVHPAVCMFMCGWMLVSNSTAGHCKRESENTQGEGQTEYSTTMGDYYWGAAILKWNILFSRNDSKIWELKPYPTQLWDGNKK